MPGRQLAPMQGAWRRLAFVLCALVIIPRVHPDRIPLLDRFPVLGRAAWISPLHMLHEPQGQGRTCAAAAQRRTHERTRLLNRGVRSRLGVAANTVDGAVPGEETMSAKTLEWVNEKTKGGACDFDRIFERSKSRIDTYLGKHDTHHEISRDELSHSVELSKTMTWVNQETNGDFDGIVARSKQRLDQYLSTTTGDSKERTSVQKVEAEAKKEITKAFDLLDTMPKQRKSDFDVIVERSRKRIDMEAQRFELRGKREEIAKLQKSIKVSKQEVQAYRTEVEDIESTLTGAQSTGLPRSRIQDLQDQLRVSQVSLRGMERAVKHVEEQAATFLVALRDTEAQLEALRIRNELVSERERQLAKLHNLVRQLDGDKDTGKDPMSLLDVEWVAQHLEAAQAAVVKVEEDKVEQAHSDMRDFLWHRVGLNKNKAAIAAAAMPDLADGVMVGDLEDTVAWLEENVLVSSERLLSAVEQRPSILLLEIKTNLQPVLDFLQNKLSLDKRGVATVITAHPALLEANVKDELVPRLAELRQATGVAAGKVGKLVQMHPSVLGAGGLACLQPHIDFFANEMGVSKASMGRIFATLPGLTCMSVQTQLRPTHLWLLKIGVPPARIERMLLQHPKTLGYSLDNNLKPTVAYLWDEIGVRDDKIGRIVSAFPQILGLSVDSNLKPTVAFFVQEVGVPADKLAKIFSTFPQLFGLSLDNTIRPRVDFLSKEVGVPKDKMAKVISSFPNLLAYNHLDNLRPTVSYLHDVGIPTERMGKMVATHPQILGYSVEEKLLPTVQYLVEEVGVPEESIGSVVERCPKLLGCSVDNNLRPTVRFLREEVGMSEEEVGQMVMRYPSLLGLSIDNNLRPKLHYLVDQVKIEQTVIRKQLKTCPQLLAYSLEQRIKPRHRLLHCKGLKLGLHSMLSPTDLAFYQRYGGGLSRVASLKSDVPTSEREAKTSGSGSSPVYYWHNGGEEGATRTRTASSKSSKAVSKGSKAVLATPRTRKVGVGVGAAAARAASTRAASKGGAITPRKAASKKAVKAVPRPTKRKAAVTPSSARSSRGSHGDDESSEETNESLVHV